MGLLMLFLSFLKVKALYLPFWVRKTYRQASLLYRKSAIQTLTHHFWDTRATHPYFEEHHSWCFLSSQLLPQSTFMETTKQEPLSCSWAMNFLIVCYHKFILDSNFRKDVKLWNTKVWQRTRRKSNENNISKDDSCSRSVSFVYWLVLCQHDAS